MTSLSAALVLGALLAANDPDAEATFKKGNELYLAGDFNGAAQRYQSLVDEGYVSEDLFLNLGNAHYRAGRIGWAVLAFERALQLSPGDADVHANLELAHKGSVDKVVGEGEAPFFDRVLARVSAGAVSFVFLGSWLVLWGLLIWRRRLLGASRGLVTAAAITAALVTAGSGALVAGKAREGRQPHAVVVAGVSAVREGPGGSLKVSFELHEGTKVRIVATEGDYVHVRLPNGLEGWVAQADLALI